MIKCVAEYAQLVHYINQLAKYLLEKWSSAQPYIKTVAQYVVFVYFLPYKAVINTDTGTDIGS